MKKDFSHRKPESFIRQPNYPGGKKALDEFVKENLRYPEEAINNKIEGTVSVEHDVDIFGNVTDAKVKHGIGYGCDEEAVRLVKLMKYEKRRYKGLRVTFHKTININFRIHEASAPPKAEQTVTFTIKEEKKNQGTPGTPNSPVITYTIRIDPQ